MGIMKNPQPHLPQLFFPPDYQIYSRLAPLPKSRNDFPPCSFTFTNIYISTLSFMVPILPFVSNASCKTRNFDIPFRYLQRHHYLISDRLRQNMRMVMRQSECTSNDSIHHVIRYYNSYLYAQHIVTNRVLNLGYRGHSDRLIPSFQKPNRHTFLLFDNGLSKDSL